MLLQRTTPCGEMGVLYVTVVLVGSTLAGGGRSLCGGCPFVTGCVKSVFHFAYHVLYPSYCNYSYSICKRGTVQFLNESMDSM